jgi:hypothetical protein
MPKEIRNITNACRALTQGHNHVANIIREELSIKCTISKVNPTPNYKYKPQSVLQNSKYKLHSDRLFINDRNINENRLDKLILNKNPNSMLKNLANPIIHNLYSTIIRQLQKHADLKYKLINVATDNDHHNIISVNHHGSCTNKLHETLKLFNFRPALYIILHKAAVLMT